MEGVLAEAGVVRGVGKEPTVGRKRQGADGHEGLVLRELVHVEDDAFSGAVRAAIRADGAAAVPGVLLALLGAGDVLPGTNAVRDGAVILLNVGEDLVVDSVLQRCETGHVRGGEGVLRFQVGSHAGCALVPEPGVVVVEVDSVKLGGAGIAFGDGRLNESRDSVCWGHEISLPQHKEFPRHTCNALWAGRILTIRTYQWPTGPTWRVQDEDEDDERVGSWVRWSAGRGCGECTWAKL